MIIPDFGGTPELFVAQIGKMKLIVLLALVGAALAIPFDPFVGKKSSSVPEMIIPDFGGKSSYSPKSYSPKSYSPKSYSPKSYSPKGYTPGYKGKEMYAPKKFHEKEMLVPKIEKSADPVMIIPGVTKGKGIFIPQDPMKIKRDIKSSGDLVIPD